MERADLKDRLKFEIEREDSDEVIEIDLDQDGDLLAEVRRRLSIDGELHLFERDKDEPLTRADKGRKHMRLLATTPRAIEVVVRYEHRSIETQLAHSELGRASCREKGCQYV